jgi:hypothetical protein
VEEKALVFAKRGSTLIFTPCFPCGDIMRVNEVTQYNYSSAQKTSNMPYMCKPDRKRDPIMWWFERVVGWIVLALIIAEVIKLIISYIK